MYDLANYYLEQNDFEKCIQSLDKACSSKGYLLRGKVYERLKKYNKAIENYKKSIEIVPEPLAFHRLGFVHFIQRNYEEALTNLLEYEKRKPCFSIYNVRFIIQVYKELGNQENQKRYEEIADYFSDRRNQKLFQYKKI